MPEEYVTIPLSRLRELEELERIISENGNSAINEFVDNLQENLVSLMSKMNKMKDKQK